MPTYTTTTIKRGGIFIPVNIYTPFVNVEITFAGDASPTNCNSRLLSFSIHGEKNALKTASIEFSNDEGYWVNKISGGENVSIYVDFVDGTTKRFYGKITEKSFGLTAGDGWVFNINARQAPGFGDKTFAKQYSAVNAVTVIADIVDSFFSGIVTRTNVQATINTSITKTFSSTSGVRALASIMELSSCCFYVDETNDLHVFTTDSVQNTTESVAFGVNLSSCSRLGKNYDDVINRVIVYGQDEGNGVNYLRTVNNTSSQSTYWVKDLVVRDGNVTSDEEAYNDASAAIVTSVSQDGSVTVAGGIPSINAGEQIRVSIPYTELMDWITINSFTHSYSAGSGLTTSLNISKSRRMDILQNDTNVSIESSYTAVNSYGMTEGVVLNFNGSTDIDTLSSCELLDGELRLTSGSSTGTCTTVSRTASSSFTKASVVFDGEILDNCTADISTDNGITWSSVSRSSFTVVSGSTYKFRINLSQISATEKPVVRAFGGYVG